ncbi:hypothetical protein IFM89_038629 [Coptis chinensis]|uniref:RING-type E3 ubiquitin transferase n=1 Tax=Coptis chinensis TaxID=261450 RepID=A0A835I9I7_9MAGN|nr:hypothetical protein IFM89_038629 [Coptis chinensis]
MEGSWDGSLDTGSQSDDRFRLKRTHIEPIYDAFVCPLTKQVMRDHVTLENGQSYEREAIEKWLKECKESGRNEAAQLDIAHRSLTPGSSEQDVLKALKYIQHICQKSRSNRHFIRSVDLIPITVNMLKSISRRVRCKTLETLCIVAEEDAYNKEVIAEGDTIRAIMKFLSHEQSKEREEAMSLLYELSKSKALCEKIGDVNGAILILVGMTSSNSENVLTVEKAKEMCNIWLKMEDFSLFSLSYLKSMLYQSMLGGSKEQSSLPD